MSASASNPPNHSGTSMRGLHVLAIVTAFFVFPLMLVGAGVTSKGAGMVYADWPTSDGHLLNPPNWWEGDHTRWEHGHRLIGWVVGFLAIGVAAFSWRHGSLVRWLGLSTLIAISVQGLLGGFRVMEISRGFAMVHGIWGQLCFCLALSVAVVSGTTWKNDLPAAKLTGARFLRNLSLAGFGCTVVQLTLGAAYRHFASDTALLMHVLWAMVVTMLVGWLAMWVMGVPSAGRRCVQLGRIIAALIAIQLLLGGFAFTVKVMAGGSTGLLAWAVPTAHVAVGALLLGSLMTLLLFSCRLYRSAEQCELQPGASCVVTV